MRARPGLVTALLVLLPREARAVEHVVARLVFDGGAVPETCVGAPELRAAVAARLGYDPFEDGAGLDTVVVRVRRGPAGIEGTFERRDASQRPQGKPATITSRSENCGEVTSALAIGIAIALDPLSITREPPTVVAPTAPAQAPTSPSVPSPAPLPPQPQSPSPATPRAPTQLVVGVGPSLTLEALPGPSFGVRAFAGISHGPFELDVEGAFDAPAGTNAPGGSVEASLALGTVAPCFRYWLAVGCASASFGSMRGRGMNFQHSYLGDTLYAGVGARLGIELPLGSRFGLRVIVEGQVPLQPTELVANGTTVWSSPSFTFAAAPMLVGHFF